MNSTFNSPLQKQATAVQAHSRRTSAELTENMHQTSIKSLLKDVTTQQNTRLGRVHSELKCRT